MPLVPNLDDSPDVEHPLVKSTYVSQKSEVHHEEWGAICVTKNEWFSLFFSNLEILSNSTLARRLAHASLSNSMKMSYETWSPKKSFLTFLNEKYAINAFENWSKDRIHLGRGIVTPVNWPYSFHIERPLMVSIEVGEICAYLQSIIGHSLRYQWRDDGGSNASVTFEKIDVPLNQHETIAIENFEKLPTKLDVDKGFGWPTRDGIKINVIPTAVFHEFYKTLGELEIEISDDPIISTNELAGELENLVSMASLKSCSNDSQRYLLDNYEQMNTWFNQRIESNGFGKLISASFGSDLKLKFRFFIPWPILSGIILDAWQRNNGILGVIDVKSIEGNSVEMIIRSRREIA